MLKLMLAAIAPLLAPPASAALDPEVAEIVRLEQQWGQAFVTRDFDLIERIVAPEYRLVGAGPDGSYTITRRADWMANSRAFKSHGFEIQTVDVSRVGDTAVASAQGLWTVSRKVGEAPRSTRFFVTDTWVRRGGNWQVIHRYSHRLPGATWPPLKPVAAQAK